MTPEELKQEADKVKKDIELAKERKKVEKLKQEAEVIEKQAEPSIPGLI